MKGQLGGESRIHIIGVGGGAMSAMAVVLSAWGADVSGSDQRPSRALERLRSAGIRVTRGHDPANLADARLVVRSRAVRDSNPEVVAARAAGIRVWERTEALAEMVSGSRAVGVTGTHGKTSTTAMLTLILRAAGLDPSFIVGEEITELGTNAHAGAGDLMVVEADESDGTFLALPLEAGLVTNAEPDHLDHFGDLRRLRAAMATFVERLPGPRLVCADDHFLATLPNTLRYGSKGEVEYRLEACEPRGLGSWVVISTPVGRVSFPLAVAGRHFALNATGAAGLALELGAPLEAVESALSRFRGVGRRFEVRGHAAGITLVDDYAHLPTEVAETIRAARPLGRRVVAVFQPHLYSRTEALWPDFGPAFAEADHVVITDVFAAREDPRPGVTGRLVADAAAAAGPAVDYEPDRSRLAARVAALAQEGDIILTMGAGDITDLADELLPLLEAR